MTKSITFYASQTVLPSPTLRQRPIKYYSSLETGGLSHPPKKEEVLPVMSSNHTSLNK